MGTLKKADMAEASAAARELSKLGAGKGGRARANLLTPEERREIAQKAVKARWEKAGKVVNLKPADEAAKTEPTADGMPYSLFRGSLDIGDVTLECHVLSNLQRVLTQREVVRVLTRGRDSGNLQRYLERVPGYDAEALASRTVQFRVPDAGVAVGYDAELLIEICELYLRARDNGALKPSQKKLADMAEIIIRACAKVGIIALIDEATGYQKVRRERALQLKLQAFIADDMQEWAKTFPDEFWFELARLENVRYSARHRPLRWGKYVMAFVYDAIDKDVGQELRRRNPNPQHRSNHHQWLQEFGKEKLNNQLQQVIAIMKSCDDMDEFRKRFAKVFKGVEQKELDLIWEDAN